MCASLAKERTRICSSEHERHKVTPHGRESIKFFQTITPDAQMMLSPSAATEKVVLFQIYCFVDEKSVDNRDLFYLDPKIVGTLVRRISPIILFIFSKTAVGT